MRISLLSLFFLLCTPLFAQSTFPEKFARELSSDFSQKPSAEMLKKMKEVHVVFIGGFMNQDRMDYFEDNVKTLKEDFEVESASIIFPKVSQGVEDNAILIVTELRKIISEQKKPLVIIAHSMGCPEAFYALLKNPDLIDSVSRVVMVQGAFEGTPIAKLGIRATLGILNVWDGLRNLKPEVMKRRVYDALNTALPQDIQKVSDRMLYVKTSQARAKVSQPLRFSSFILERWFSANDGLLLTEHHTLPGHGHDLGVIEADHCDLTNGIRMSNEPYTFRRAFMRALVESLY